MKEYKSIEEAVADFVAKRDDLRAWSEKTKKTEEQKKSELAEIEAWLLDKSNTLGVDSFKTKAGTAYRRLKEHFRIGDWSSFVEYVKRTNNFQLFEKRVAKLAAKEITEKEGLPDGIDYSSEFEMGVLRPAKKKEKEGGDDLE